MINQLERRCHAAQGTITEHNRLLRLRNAHVNSGTPLRWHEYDNRAVSRSCAQQAHELLGKRVTKEIAENPDETFWHKPVLKKAGIAAVLTRYPTLEEGGEAVRMGCMATRKHETTLAVERTKVQAPPLYKVLILNDDYTPMDFVVNVLQKFFGMEREQATRVMLAVHHEGKGLCGTYPRDVAATKVEQVGNFARQHQHPLACVMEEA